MPNFVILCQARTGSTLLGAMLRSSPCLRFEGEIFNRMHWPRPWGLLWRCWHRLPYPYLVFRSRRRRSAGKVACYGFKAFPDHFHRPTAFIHHLARSGWQVVHLQRRRLFDHTLSSVVANVTRRYTRRPHETVPLPRLQLDPAHFLQHARDILADYRLINHALASIPHFDVIYEDHLLDDAGRTALLPPLLGFLGVPPLAEPPGHTVKQWESPYEEFVTNHAALVEAFVQSGLPRDVLSTSDT